MDECLGAPVIRFLSDAGATVERYTDAEPDAVWIPRVAVAGWVILTRDKKMRRHEVERALLVQGGARWVAFTGGKLKVSEFLLFVEQWMPAVIQLLRDRPQPLIVQVNRTEILDCTRDGPPARLKSYRRRSDGQ